MTSLAQHIDFTDVNITESDLQKSFAVFQRLGMSPTEAIARFLLKTAEKSDLPSVNDVLSDFVPALDKASSKLDSARNMDTNFNFDLERMKDRVENDEFVVVPDFDNPDAFLQWVNS